MKPLVYIAGPYTNPDPVLNTRAAVMVGDTIMRSGHATPLVPHLSMLWHAMSPKDIEDWYEYDIELLTRCDAVLRIPGASTGADNEVEYAEQVGIPVFESLPRLYEWIENR